MSNSSVPVGPVDVAVVLFPEAELGGGVLGVVADAIASGTVRLLDALIVQRDAEGDVSIIDADADSDAEGEVLTVLSSLSDHLGLLGEDDARLVAAELAPGTSAAMVAWENIWAVRMRAAIADAGGAVVAHERIDASSLEEAYTALRNAEEGS